MQLPLILASESPSRLKLLQQINIHPDQVCPAYIDESEHKKEKPNDLALRLAIAKAQNVSTQYENAVILAADTVSACGRRILPKAENDEQVRCYLKLLSGRRHKVYSGVCVLMTSHGNIIKQASRLVTSIVQFKRLEDSEIEQYIASKEGLGKSGACSIEGRAAAFTIWMSGSFSNIVGLPLYETASLLRGIGYQNHTNSRSK
jgi:septum formation protein